MTYEELLKQHESEYEAILQIEGVHGVGIGRDKNGNLCRKVFSHLKDTEMLKKNPLLQDCEIVYEKQPGYEAFQEEAALNDDHGRYRPMLSGIQLYLNDGFNGWFGTLGAFVKSRDPLDSDTYILSNRHVLKEEDLYVYQPYRGEDNQVAAVTDVESGAEFDCALAMVLDYNFEPGIIEEIGKINGTKVAEVEDIGCQVTKRGRTTCRTRGIITAIDCYVVWKGGREQHHMVRIVGDNVIFSKSGDSGSPIVFEDGHEFLGILCGGSDSASYATSVDDIIESLNIEIIQ